MKKLNSPNSLGGLRTTITTLDLLTCLTDKTNHPVKRAESQQIAMWWLLYQVRHPGRYISRLQTIWGYTLCKVNEWESQRRFEPKTRTQERDGVRRLSFPEQKASPTISLPCLDGILPQRRSGIIPRMVAQHHWPIGQVPNQMSEPAVPLVLSRITIATTSHQQGKTNLSHDGLNPAHVPYWRVNNPTLGEFCFAMIGRADIEGSKSDVAMNAWPPQASSKYPVYHVYMIYICIICIHDKPLHTIHALNWIS